MEDVEEGHCGHCSHYLVIYHDPEGTWVECECSAGYID